VRTGSEQLKADMPVLLSHYGVNAESVGNEGFKAWAGALVGLALGHAL
jgi:hypothetical protein